MPTTIKAKKVPKNQTLYFRVLKGKRLSCLTNLKPVKISSSQKKKIMLCTAKIMKIKLNIGLN